MRPSHVRPLGAMRSSVSWSLVVTLVITLTLVGEVPARADDPIGATTQPLDLADCPTPPTLPTIWSAPDWHAHTSNTHCKMNQSDQRTGSNPVLWGMSGNY